MPSPFLLSRDGESKTVRAKTCLDTGFSQHGWPFFWVLFFGHKQEKVSRLSGRDRTKK